jgi:DNA mismatch endonuclease (patch repair protein)
MADIFNPKKRSEIMSLIKAKNTKPEILVFKYLRANNIYFQKHYKSKEKINIDIAQPRKRKALFIDGEFWHGYTLERRKDKLPMFWVQKIIRNVKRDRRYRAELKANGWQILRVWEHELNKKNCEETLEKIYKFLTS